MFSMYMGLIGQPKLVLFQEFLHWSRKWQPTPVFLLGKSHGHRNLLGYSPWGHRVRHDCATQHTHTQKSGSEIKGKIIKSYCQLKIKLLRNTSVKPLGWFSNYTILICMSLFRSLHQKLAICVPQVKSCSLSDFTQPIN